MADGTVINETCLANGYSENVVVKTTTYTAIPTDDVIVCNSASAFTLNLPASTGGGKSYKIKNINGGLITLKANGTDTIDGSNTQLLYQDDGVYISDYTSGKWIVT